MKTMFRRLLALCLCFATVAGFIPALMPAMEADAAVYSSYTTIAKIGTHGSCNAMQGMDVDGTYIYCAKINSDTETTCAIGRIHKTSGDTVWLTNSATGTYYFSQLAHANDLAVCTVNSVKTMFVGTGGAGKGDYSLVRFAFDGTTLKEVGHYNMKHNGTEKYIAGVKVVATSSTEITLVLKSGNYVFAATIPYSTTSGDIAMSYLGKLDFSAVSFGGTVRDLSGYVVQGFGYKDNKLFVPMTANYQTSTSHISSIVCFDIDGIKGGNIKPDPNMSVWIEDTTYPDLFEIESCGISPTDGKLYFATNCRKTSTDGNHDSVHVLNGFVYDPAMGDLTTGQNYHFRPSAGKLKSVTTGASVFNSVLQHLGTVSASNKITGARWSMDMPLILKHDEPWILTWEASNWTSNSLLLSTYDTSSFANNYYLYRRSGSGLVAMGYYSSGQYNNYGVDLSSHGIDDTVNHKYQLKNVVNDDGTNMVYLWVDGTKLGAMNNYYVGATSQSKTVNWISGKDFSFSYIGTAQHPVSGTLQYLKVWTKGNINAFDEPSVFRWETQNDQMTPISQFGYTTNTVTVLGGSCTEGTYSSYYSRLAQPVVLMHDRPWVVEWKTPSWSGNTMLFSSGDTALKMNASYLYRSNDIVAFGYCDGAKCHSYGIMLADHEVDAAAGHTYRLTNKLNTDGTNMIYLTVDGTELGPMNRYYLGSEYQGATVDFVNGKDFTFPYMGNYNYGLNQPYDYIQVWENGIPADDPINRYRWEPSGSTFKNITTDGWTANTSNRVIGSLSGGVFSEAAYRLDTPIVLQHNMPWTVSWQSSGTWTGTTAGGGFLFSASLTNGQVNAPYLYRRKDSEMIGLGIYNGSRHVQYGVTLSDHGIDGTASHTYTLTNKVADDGTNMIYLAVDGVELGAMNNYYIGGSAQGTTSNYLSGKDFTFTYLGTPRFPLSNVTLNYLEVSEGCVHSYTSQVTSAATCTAAGVMTYTCGLCGGSYTESIAATGHSYEAAVTAPTCTAEGYTTYTCTACGDSYQGDTTAAVSHSYKSVVTVPTCTAEGYTTYTCTVCGDSYQGATTAALGHCYNEAVTAPTCTAGGYTTYTCTACDDSYTGNATDPIAHSYSGGSCTVCGAEDPDYVEPLTITLRYPSLSFEDEVLMNVYFQLSTLNDVWELGLLTYDYAAAAGDVSTAKTVVPGYTYNAATGLLCVQTEGIPAKCLGDEIWFSVYAKMSDGSYVYSKVVSYSPRAYAYNQLSAGDESVKPLMVALLNYGATAQTFFGYNTDSLVNDALTAEQLALVEGYREDMMNTVSTPTVEKEGSFANTGGYVRRYPTVSFEGAFSINYYYTPSNAPIDGITMYYWTQADYDAASVLTAENATAALKMTGSGTGQYLAAVEGIAAKDLDKGIYVAFCYSDGTNSYASGVLAYSIGTYCTAQASAGGDLTPFAQATAVYGYHAKTLLYQGV